jgi:hypothetical protein
MITSKLRLLLGALALVCGCRSGEPGPSTGSETHFLSWCSNDESCGEGLACLCGVCSAACSDSASCVSLGSAVECVAVASRPADQSCPDAPVEAWCEAGCSLDTDCAPLGGAHRCDRGFCRQLAPECQSGQVAGNQLVLIGDSFLADSHQVTTELETLARSTGALQSEERYRDHSSTLVTPFGGAADLTTQYAAAASEGAMRIVVMDAGGPDALLTCPEPPTESCPALQNAVAGADQLLRQMATDGVEAVIYFFYPDPEDPSLRARFDVLRPLMEATCDASPVGCHFLDLRPTFEGHGDFLLAGGIIPTAAGSTATAAAIWSLMQRRCIAQ